MNNRIYILETNPLTNYAFQCLFKDQNCVFLHTDRASLFSQLKDSTCAQELYLINMSLLSDADILFLVETFPKSMMNMLFYAQMPFQNELAYEKIDLLLSAGARSIILDITPNIFSHAIDCLKNKYHFYCQIVTRHMIQIKAKKVNISHVLTAREVTVLKLLAKGLTSKQIATHLKVGTRTVEAHRGNIMKKLKCNNAVQCIQEAQRMKLLSKPEAPTTIDSSHL